MPGNVAAASPSGVLPQSLAIAFSESRVFPMLAVAYHDTTIERSLLVDGVNPAASLRTWRQTRRLKADRLIALRTFFETKKGGAIPFYFYAPDEVIPGTAIGSNYDATGAATQGRHTVVFINQEWAETVGISRCDAALELREVA